MTSREAFEAWFKAYYIKHGFISSLKEAEEIWQVAYKAGRTAEREACEKDAGEFARKWWGIHCASNKHMETTRKAHDDFCSLQNAIRTRGKP